MFNSPSVPSFQRISVPMVVGVSTATGAIFFFVMLLGLRAQKIPHAMGMESMLGKTGFVRRDLNPSGIVQLASEEWTADLAEGESPLPKGARVEVVGVEGLHLIVRKKTS
jgi:membrane-bound serine protease (ClpP class)